MSSATLPEVDDLGRIDPRPRSAHFSQGLHPTDGDTHSPFQGGSGSGAVRDEEPYPSFEKMFDEETLVDEEHERAPILGAGSPFTDV